MAERLEFDSAPAAVSERRLEFDEAPVSGGAFAHKEIGREQEIRAERLQRLLTATPNPGFSERVKDQATSGVMRPISGLMSVGEGLAKEYLGNGQPATVGEYYRGGTGAEEDFIQRARANTNKGWKAPLGVATDVAGSIVGGGKSVGPTSLRKQAAQSAVQGGVEGASRNADDLGNAVGGAATGAGIGAGSSLLVGGLLDRLKRVKGAEADIGVASRGGNAQQMKTDAGEIFETLKDAGIKYSPKETAPLVGNVTTKLAKEGFNPNMHKELIPVLGEIGGTQGRGMSWDQLRNMQTQISDLKAHADPRLRRMAGELASEVDDFLKTAKPTMPASSVAAGVNPASDVAEAKKLYATGKHSGKIEGLAEVAAGAKDPAAATQSAFKRYSDTFAKNPDKYNPNSPEQRRLLAEIAAGSPKSETAAKYMNYAARGVGGLGTAGAVAVGGAPLFGLEPSDKASSTVATALGAAAALKGGSSAFKKAAADASSAKVNDLLRHIATGSTSTANAHIPRELLAKILAARDAGRGAGNYASSFVDKEQRR